MNLREEFEKEKGYDCYAYSQDYAGAEQYKDGFNDEYVEWLESKVNNVALDDVIPIMKKVDKGLDENIEYSAGYTPEEWSKLHDAIEFIDGIAEENKPLVRY